MPDRHTWFCLVGLLYRWQTFVAGILALLGAALTVWVILRQLHQTDAFQRDARKRDERAARAVLPVALSEITQYAIDCIRLLAPHISTKNYSVPAGGPLVAPRFPEGVLEPCQACVRFADERRAEQIAEILRWLQVQHARLDSLIDRTNSRHNRMVMRIEALGAIMGAAELHALCGGLFPYARGEQPDPRNTFQRGVRAAIAIASPQALDLPCVVDAISARTAPHTFAEP